MMSISMYRTSPTYDQDVKIDLHNILSAVIVQSFFRVASGQDY